MLEESKTLIRHNYTMRHLVSLWRDGGLGSIKLPYNKRNSDVSRDQISFVAA
jgi:hypothetical protein